MALTFEVGEVLEAHTHRNDLYNATEGNTVEAICVCYHKEDGLMAYGASIPLYYLHPTTRALTVWQHTAEQEAALNEMHSDGALP